MLKKNVFYKYAGIHTDSYLRLEKCTLTVSLLSSLVFKTFDKKWCTILNALNSILESNLQYFST